MKNIDLPEFMSLMESFGITDLRFIAPLFQQLIEADGFGGGLINPSVNISVGGCGGKTVKVADDLNCLFAVIRIFRKFYNG